MGFYRAPMAQGAWPVTLMLAQRWLNQWQMGLGAVAAPPLNGQIQFECTADSPHPKPT
jgi:hypothetical protein